LEETYLSRDARIILVSRSQKFH